MITWILRVKNNKLISSVLSFQCVRTRLQREIKLDRKPKPLRRCFNRFFLLTNCLSAGTCMLIGDLVEQEIEYRSNIVSERYNWQRAGHMFIVGSFLGTFYHFYYTTLERLIPQVTLKTTIIKVICDQIFATPVTLTSLFCGTEFLDGKPMDACKNELKKKFLKTYIVDCIYWPPLQFVNFYFLPISYRVIYVNVTNMIYNIFLSYMKHYDQVK